MDEGLLVSRVKLDMPDSFDFETTLEVRIDDINYGGHLGNDSVLSLMHEARVRFFRTFGYSEMNVDGSAIIMADSVITYQSESFHGDIIRIEVGVGEIGSSG